MGKARTFTSGWKCPKCGRTFRHRTREHSCLLTSIESHLERTSVEVGKAFRAVVDLLEALGPVPVRIVPLKTMIVFSTAATFGGVTFTRARLDLGFFLDVPLRHPPHSPRRTNLTAQNRQSPPHLDCPRSRCGGRAMADRGLPAKPHERWELSGPCCERSGSD